MDSAAASSGNSTISGNNAVIGRDGVGDTEVEDAGAPDSSADGVSP